MVFSTTTLFKDISCPADQECALVNCIFKHELRPQLHGTTATVQLSPYTTDEPRLKRRKITYEKLEDKPASRAELIRLELAQTRAQKDIDNPKESSLQKPSSLGRPISPPSLPKKKVTAIDHATSPFLVKQVEADNHDIPLSLAVDRTTPQTTKKCESLNPRVITPAPESHSKRTVYLQHIHSDMARLNRSLKESTVSIDGVEPSKLQAFVLPAQDLIILALTEEEAVARGSPKVYNNLIRNRIAAYKRMKPSEWLQKLKTTLLPEASAPHPNESAKIRSAITAFEKLVPCAKEGVLQSLKIKELSRLSDHGYIIRPPTGAEAAEAKATVELSHNHEGCERCGARFRVFPDRDPQTGGLTTNGPCRYHWARKSFPTRKKTDAYTGDGEATYRCCGQSLGTAGCAVHTDHVFKITSPARLAVVLPFIATPVNDNRRRSPSGAVVYGVVFDCEMGYTTLGLELIRLTAISWPDKEPLLDFLVRPLGTVIDLNTRFSGVKPEHFSSASPFDYDRSITFGDSYQVVPDTATARGLLCDFLSGDDIPLMGHAIENDLNTVRLCHTNLVDTVVLYSHPRGLPMRYGLKMLAKKHLGRSIQMGGSDGHDSLEDATATADLITDHAILTAKQEGSATTYAVKFVGEGNQQQQRQMTGTEKITGEEVAET